MSSFSSALNSLQQGNWFKLICGASYQHLPSIRNLALVYSLAGADCIDMAADQAVIRSVIEGVKTARSYCSEAIDRGYKPQVDPLLMVSINDGEDPHFRKATFNSQNCPTDCSQPCINICPAEAIAFNNINQGVIEELCYGCGRCLPICPIDIIETKSTVISPQDVLNWFDCFPLSAIEIHTQQGHWQAFQILWEKVLPHLHKLKLIAISCPYTSTVTDYLSQINNYIQPLDIPLIWQVDGRPMSGDIGSGTTHLTIKYAQQVKKLNFSGYIQLAGGTNEYTIPKVRSLDLPPSTVSGAAYGSKGRKLIADILHQLESRSSSNQLELYPDLLWEAVEKVQILIAPLKNS